MAAAERLKRRLVRELVADNLALRSRLPVARGRRRRRPLAALPILALALVPAGWALAAYLAGAGGGVAASAAAPAAGAGAAAGRAPFASPAGGAAAASSIPGPGASGLDGGRARGGVPGGSGAEDLPSGSLRGRSEVPGDGAAPEASAPLDPAAFPLAVERVVLDPGHGGDSFGTRTPSGLSEKELALDIAVRVREFLQRRGFEVVLTRDGDADLPLAERARRANDEGADLFVSIHLNWIENRRVRGVETYYLGPTDDPFLTQLAAAENRGSGYSLADLKKLVEEVYVGARQLESRRLAEHVQASLLTALRGVNPGVEDRGVKTAPFIVLMTAEMPAILAEVSCLSNEREAELLARPLYREHIAEAVAAGIRAYAESLANPDLGGMSS